MTDKVPTVIREADGSYSLCISPDTVLHWRFEADSNGTLCSMTIETPPETLWLSGDRKVTFPVRVLQ
jgi:hypothetical protein